MSRLNSSNKSAPENKSMRFRAVRSTWIRHLSAFGIFAICVAIYFLPVIIGFKCFPFDARDQFHPFARYVADTYRSGHLPLWNPYVSCGTPVAGDCSYQTFSPLPVLLGVLPNTLTVHAYDMGEIFVILLAGFCVYLLAMDLEISWLGSMLAGVAFMFGGPIAQRTQHTAQIESMLFVPLAFLLTKRLLDTGRKVYLVLGTFTFAILFITCGQIAYWATVACIAYVIYRAVKSDDKRAFFASRGGSFVLMLLFAMGMACIQVIPSLEWAHQSQRPAISYAEASRFSMDPRTLLTLICPDFFGSVRGGASYWGTGDPTEMYLYIGAIPLLLGLYALTLFTRLRKMEYKFFAVLVLMSLLYAVGSSTPVHSILFHLLPGVKFFRRCSDAFYLFHLGLVLLAGVGLDAIFGREKPDVSRKSRLSQTIITVLITLGFGLAVYSGVLLAKARGISWTVSDLSLWRDQLEFLSLLMVCLYITHHRPKFRLAMCVLLFAVSFVDCTVINSNGPFNTGVVNGFLIDENTASGSPDSQIIPFLREHLQDDNGNPSRFEPVFMESQFDNGPCFWHIQSTAGYDPVELAKYKRYAATNTLSRGRLPHGQPQWGLFHSYNSPLFDLLGAKYIVTQSHLKDIDPSVDAKKFRLVYEHGISIYENLNVFPRAFYVSHATVAPSDAAAEAELLKPGFDPRRSIVIDHAPHDMSFPRDARGGDDSPDGVVSFRKYEPCLVELETVNSRPGYVFLSDTWYPGWNVYVDGKRGDILRADLAFRAVAVDSGRHRVEFRFEPKSVSIGAAIAFASVLALIAYPLAHSRRKAKKV